MVLLFFGTTIDTAAVVVDGGCRWGLSMGVVDGGCRLCCCCCFHCHCYFRYHRYFFLSCMHCVLLDSLGYSTNILQRYEVCGEVTIACLSLATGHSVRALNIDNR